MSSLLQIEDSSIIHPFAGVVMSLPESLALFECRACGKIRPNDVINTFKHPIIEDGKIYGYRHFNYCMDNLECYVKASRRENEK
jgi:hypothetical protein